MSPYEILDEAVADLDGASTWYEEQRRGLGLELVAEFRERVASALEMPGVGSPVGKTPGGNIIRRYRLRRFKRYAILMATIDEVPTVLAFQHSSRRPGYWRDRLR
ncbi:MAG: type II toxin-antitoxin system RelE/ParE family toxin [Deltaproteobacteria bacterium]|nr:type II toxin-antitoxin system RelE/ParE family toxin [Deltaproteobacteria bacterium]